MTDYIVFYSLTGKSRETAERFARAIDAKLLEIVEVRPKKPGFRGFTSGVLDSLFERRPEIKSTPGLATSDRVILCGPIWAGRVAGPIRTWLNEHGKQAGQFVWVPHSGANRAWPKAIAEITDSPAIRPRESSTLRRATSPRARPRVRPPSLPHRLSN